MEIYADPVTINCRKVLAGLQFLEVDYALVPVGYLAGEHKADAYLSINPNGSLPALKDGDFTLWESNAILQYAAEKHHKTAFYPTDPIARADVNRWLLWESSSWMPTCYLYLVENCVKPLMGGATDQALLDSGAENFALRAGVLDARLASSRWLCGDAPTIADIAVAAPMHLHAWAGLPLDNHPNLKRWMTTQVEQLPAWKATNIDEGFVANPLA
jgi:glutathione S-transferase